ncbi:MAG TPA: hypothetical protein VFS58_09920 [Steroidobacteraceae bacterium]|nr:hypothetical protein [Steroidobacteraceae bacterium]
MKPTLLGLLIAALAFGASTIYLSVQLEEERAQADKVAATLRTLNARIAELESVRQQRFAASGSFGDLTLGQDEMPIAPPAPVEKGESSTDTADGPQVVNTPPPRSEAFQKMMRSQLRANNKRIYADLGAQLGLSKEDAARLIDMLTDQQVENFGRMREPTTDLAGRKRLQDESSREDQAELENFLGVSKAAALRDYQETIPARQEVEALARQLEGADATLSDDQQKRLVAALVAERKLIPQPKMADGTTPEEYNKAYAEWQSNYNERVSAQANTILDSGQMNAYSEYQQWQKEMREQMATRRAVRGQRGAAGGNVTFSTVTMPIAAEAEQTRDKP